MLEASVEAPLGAGATDRQALAILAGFLAARLVFAFLLGPGVDESYTLAISRTLSLSYFDHPPLHQWLAHFSAQALGEGAPARLPFIALFAATGWLTYLLTRDLFGREAAVVALFSLNVAPFFFASAGTWIVPDGPLLFGLALAALALARLFFGEDEGKTLRLWLLAGLGFGLAGLSKYSAALTVAGLAAFMALVPLQRRWLKAPAPYVAAVLAAAMVAPVFVWNAEHSWVSFAFQGARGAPAAFRPVQGLQMTLGEIVYLFPWLFAALVAGLVAAVVRRGDERRLFLLCLALPPIVVFTFTPFWGGRGLPQWTMPGWLFTFPLLGAWVKERAVSPMILRRWALLSASFLAATVAVVAVQARTGWPLRLFSAARAIPDPTLEAFGWDGLRKAPALNPPPAFVVATKWSDAGKIALALGPTVPVYVVSADPRGWAFVDGGASFVGRDGVIVAGSADLAIAEALARPLFHALEVPGGVSLARNGYPEVELALVPAIGLKRPLPIPYPGLPD